MLLTSLVRCFWTGGPPINARVGPRLHSHSFTLPVCIGAALTPACARSHKDAAQEQHARKVWMLAADLVGEGECSLMMQDGAKSRLRP